MVSGHGLIEGDPAPSWYAATATPAPVRPALAGERRADVCVVGAGFTGLSAALELASRGFDVVVLEARQTGFGASGRNGGQVCTGFSCGTGPIAAARGEAVADACWNLAAEARDRIAGLVARYNIDCDLRHGYLHAALSPRALDGLRATAEDWTRRGEEGIEILSREALGARLDSPAYHGALRETRAGHLHPLNYCLGLARAAEAEGATIHENSPALRIEGGARPVVHTVTGSVRADHLVLAGNAYLGRLDRWLSRYLMPVGSYILATEPLGEARARALIRDGEAVADTRFIIDYFRLTADTRLLFGGRASYSTLEPADLFRFMRPRMLRVFPQLTDTRGDYCWGGHIGITASRMVQVGRRDGNIWFAHGFSGQGVALAGMCGKLLGEAIAGTAERHDLLAGFRHLPFPGGPLRTPLLVLAVLWYRLRDALG